jgi:hypothetical protein
MLLQLLSKYYAIKTYLQPVAVALSLDTIRRSLQKSIHGILRQIKQGIPQGWSAVVRIWGLQADKLAQVCYFDFVEYEYDELEVGERLFNHLP